MNFYLNKSLPLLLGGIFIILLTCCGDETGLISNSSNKDTISSTKCIVRPLGSPQPTLLPTCSPKTDTDGGKRGDGEIPDESPSETSPKNKGNPKGSSKNEGITKVSPKPPPESYTPCTKEQSSHQIGSKDKRCALDQKETDIKGTIGKNI